MRRCLAPLVLLAACFSEDPIAEPSESSSTSSSSESTSTTSSSSSTSTSEPSSSTLAADTSSDDSSSSSTALEESSSSSTGELVTDWALYFDGSNAATSTEVLDLGLGNDFTVEAWVRVDSADALGTIASFLGVGTSGWSFGFDVGSDLSFGIYDNNGAWHEVSGANASELSPGWTHVAAIKSGTSLFLYVAGELDSTATTAAIASSPTVSLVLGDGTMHEAGSYFGIDDLRISTGRRYQTNFEPSLDLLADSTTQIRDVFDEADGSITIGDGNVSATFSIAGTPTWIEGSM